MAAEKTDEKKPAKSQGSAGNEDGKVLVSLADIQKMIEDAIEQHDREKGLSMLRGLRQKRLKNRNSSENITKRR